MKTISVIILTYNHEVYIEKAIQGVLKQKTEYPFEIVIGEDASTDKTASIIQKYQKEYPDKIHAILRKQNVGIRQNAIETLEACNGEYIAYLEGDDYWIDSNKLQKQVEFLENNPDYVAVYHRCRIIDENNKVINIDDTYVNKEEYTKQDLEQFLIPGQTSTLFMKNLYKNNHNLKQMIQKTRYTALDRMIPVLALHNGRIHCMQDEMSVYRYILKPGSWSYRLFKGDYLWRMYGFFIEREIEKMGKKIGFPISYKKRDAKLYIDNIRKGVYYKKIPFFLLNLFMILVGKHRCYMILVGNRMLLKKIKIKRSKK